MRSVSTANTKVLVTVLLASFFWISCKKEPVKAPEPPVTALTTDMRSGTPDDTTHINGYLFFCRSHSIDTAGRDSVNYHLFCTFADLPAPLKRGYNVWLDRPNTFSMTGNLSVTELRLNGIMLAAMTATSALYYTLPTATLLPRTGNALSSDTIQWWYKGNDAWPSFEGWFALPFPTVSVSPRLECVSRHPFDIDAKQIFSYYNEASIYTIGYDERQPPYVDNQFIMNDYGVAHYQFWGPAGTVVTMHFQASRYYYKWDHGKLLLFEFATRETRPLVTKN